MQRARTVAATGFHPVVVQVAHVGVQGRAVGEDAHHHGERLGQFGEQTALGERRHVGQ